MDIIVDKNLILSPISKLVTITEKRSLMPILSNILMAFGREGTAIYSTDLEVSAIAHVDLKIEEDCRIVVHGRKFLDILREMDNGEIYLHIEQNSLEIRQKQTNIVLTLQDSDEFPEIREIKGNETFEIEGDVLLEMVERVEFAISTDETRYILTGMYMKGLEEKIVVVGTDGFRMAQYEKKVDGVKGFKGITIPKRSISELERVVGHGDKVKV
jgi:DNA polymerase sliding clamp subunit (PCNA homolog)